MPCQMPCQMPCAKDLSLYDHVSDGYDKSHSRWLRFEGGEAQCAFEGAATALLRPGMRALDVACGTGTVARRLLKAASGNAEIVLLDTSPRMLAKCADIPAHRVKGCMTHLPFEADTFDLLTCAWGIETLVDPRPALAEFLRVTRLGGHICLVFCSDRPVRSLVGRALRHRITSTGKGRFLDHEMLHDQALQTGARRVQRLHCTGPAAAMIIHV